MRHDLNARPAFFDPVYRGGDRIHLDPIHKIAAGDTIVLREIEDTPPDVPVRSTGRRLVLVAASFEGGVLTFRRGQLATGPGLQTDATTALDQIMAEERARRTPNHDLVNELTRRLLDVEDRAKALTAEKGNAREYHTRSLADLQQRHAEERGRLHTRLAEVSRDNELLYQETVGLRRGVSRLLAAMDCATFLTKDEVVELRRLAEG